MSVYQKPLVLIIDDDAAYTAALAETFERGGLRTSSAFFAEQGLDEAKRQRPDMIILDINLQHEGQGFELLPRLQQVSDAPIVVLTGRGTVRQDLQTAGQGGATNYFNKVDALPEALSAFVRSQLAKLGKMKPRTQRMGDVVLDVQAGKMLVRGVPIPVTEMQAEVLALLMAPPAGEWKLHRKLARAMYGESGVDEKAGVRKHIARIRERLEALDMGVWIETAFGHGYRLVVKGFNDDLTNKDV